MQPRRRLHDDRRSGAAGLARERLDEDRPAAAQAQRRCSNLPSFPIPHIYLRYSLKEGHADVFRTGQAAVRELGGELRGLRSRF
eukprot:2772336-Heterocapsa_arctica.AAC.1